MFQRGYNHGGSLWSKSGGKHSGHYAPKISPVSTVLRPPGLTSSSWEGSQTFHTIMGRHGMNYENRVNGGALPLVGAGQLPGAVYMLGMKRTAEFIRTGGQLQADGSHDGQASNGDISLEKGANY